MKPVKDNLNTETTNPITGNKPVVSVIMPVYNAEKYLQEAVDSILNQTFQDFELIIIDDDSTDGTVSILESYDGVDDRICIVLNKKNKGNYPCRNQGMNIARGRYIAVMDADDVAVSERLQIQYDFMEKNPDILASGSDFIFYGKPLSGAQRKEAMAYEQIRIALIVDNCFLHPSLIVRSHILKDMGGYDEHYVYSADYDLMCRLALRGRIVNTSDVLMQYRWHSTQISQKYWTEQQQYTDEIRTKYQSQHVVKELLASEKNKQQCEDMLWQSASRKKQDLLLRIARHLILHGSFCPGPGLLKGKMGIAIFFYELYSATGQKSYNDYAGDLIDEIYENMNLYTSLFFNDGLAGIGWGFEYIIRKKYVDADADDILENLDKQIMERDIRVITDISLDRGLKGIACYVIAWCANRNKYAIRPDFITDLLESVRTRIPVGDMEGRMLAGQLAFVIKQQHIEQDGMTLLYRMIQNKKPEATFIYDKNRLLGILENGYAGLGLKILWS